MQLNILILLFFLLGGSFPIFNEYSFSYSEKEQASEIPFDTIRIGNQTWMAENLTIATSGSKCFFDTYYQRDDCQMYGRYYTWEAAKQAASQVPGWRLPTNHDFEQLLIATGGYSGAFYKLTERGNSSFQAKAAGRFEPITTPTNDYYGSENGAFKNVGQTSFFWSYNSTSYRSRKSCLIIDHYKKQVNIGNSYEKGKLSVRLIKE